MNGARLILMMLSDGSVDMWVERDGKPVTKSFNLRGEGLIAFFKAARILEKEMYSGKTERLIAGNDADN